MGFPLRLVKQSMSASKSSESTISAELITALRRVIGAAGVLTAYSDRMVFECDGFTIEKDCPDVVVFPRTTAQIAAVVSLCNQYEVPFLPRGAGTSLAGGTLAVGGGVMLVLTRMNEILEINLRDRYAIVEPGVVNIRLTQSLKGSGYHYAPDPSSQSACTIGGNVATNSGGPHTLKYGVTVNHILGLEFITAAGEIVTVGGPGGTCSGLDITGVLVGSEGTLAIVSKVWVRLTRNPQSVRTMLAVFDSVADCTTSITAIIGAGIIPAALEMIDHDIMVALEEAFKFGFPLDAEAVLIIEVDGIDAGLDDQRDRIVQLCLDNGARDVQQAEDEKQRQHLWRARKQAFGAIGRLSSSLVTQDGVVPRTQLPYIYEKIMEIGKKHDIQIVNVFHAGDGNIHPVMLFDERDASQIQRVLQAGGEILDACLEVGGSVTGEHGIGVEKMHFMKKMFTPEDLEVMSALRDAFNPENRLSPDKMLPVAGACGMERKRPSRMVAT
jgi:glycolate oxidase